jgi:hypothetical protein
VLHEGADGTVKKDFAGARARWKLLAFYQKFEHSVILVLTVLIAIVVMFAVWNLALIHACSM